MPSKKLLFLVYYSGFRQQVWYVDDLGHNPIWEKTAHIDKLSKIEIWISRYFYVKQGISQFLYWWIPIKTDCYISILLSYTTANQLMLTVRNPKPSQETSKSVSKTRRSILFYCISSYLLWNFFKRLLHSPEYSSVDSGFCSLNLNQMCVTLLSCATNKWSIYSKLLIWESKLIGALQFQV